MRLGKLRSKTTGLRYAFRDGRMVISSEVSIEIDARTVERHRLLSAAIGAASLEEHLAELGENYDPAEDADYVAHPFWERYSDLHFAQVLFTEAISGDGPWGDGVDLKGNRLVSSRKPFLAEIRKWARFNECPADEVKQLLEAGEASLRLDVGTMRAIIEPLKKQWYAAAE